MDLPGKPDNVIGSNTHFCCNSACSLITASAWQVWRRRAGVELINNRLLSLYENSVLVDVVFPIVQSDAVTEAEDFLVGTVLVACITAVLVREVAHPYRANI